MNEVGRTYANLTHTASAPRRVDQPGSDPDIDARHPALERDLQRHLRPVGDNGSIMSTSPAPASAGSAGGPATPEPGAATPATFYDAVGGHPTFEKLIRRFYQGVAGDPPLRALYPEEDLGPAEDRFRMFLEQYWGGPTTYSDQRGHPRLRMRHAPFVITPAQRDRWLRHMRDAIDSIDLAPEHEAELWAYMERVAHFMVNTLDEDPGPSQGLRIV